MKNHNITTIINDVTPKQETSFWVVIDNLFNTFKEINRVENEFPLEPSEIDELNFEDWFSCN